MTVTHRRPAPTPPLKLVTAPSLDMARPGDTIGLTRALTPARRAHDVRFWRVVLTSESVGRNRHTVTVRGKAGPFALTMAPGMPIVLSRAVAR